MNSVSTTAALAEVDTGVVRIDDAKLARYARSGYAADVLPLQPEQRTWSTFSFVTLWMGPIHNIMSYMTVAGFFILGLNVPQVVLAVMLAATIVSVGYVLNGRSAAKYGLPFAMLLRDSFGVRGSVIPALARGIVAGVVFFGTTTFVGAQALNVMFSRIWPGYLQLGGDFSLLGLNLPTIISYLLLWTITVLLFVSGSSALGQFGKWSALVVYAIIIIAAIWAFDIAGGVGPILDYAPDKPMASPLVFVACVSALVSNWAGPIVNISDMTRNAKSVGAPSIGLPFGMIVSYVLFSVVTVAIIAGTKIAFGEEIFNIVYAFDKMDHNLGGNVAVVLIILALNTGATAFVVFANLLPSGLQMTAMFPKVFNVKTAGVLTAVVGTLILPWKLVESQQMLFLFYGFIGSMFGPIAGIMLASYYLERRDRLDLDRVYVADGEVGEHPNGYNRLALTVLAVSFVVTMLGAFVKSIPFLVELNNFAFFVGVFIGFVGYALGLRRRSARSTRDAV
ncbi:putative allantoin permease [Intrasporangium mesophilum]